MSRQVEETLIRKNGMVYTPEYLSEYVARKTKQFIEADTDLHNRQVLTVADPAVGEGMLLESLSQNLLTDEKLTSLSLWNRHRFTGLGLLPAKAPKPSREENVVQACPD
jgi:hypothetical protein